MGKTYRGLTRIGSTVEARSGVDRLQWKCDNMQTLENEFKDCMAEDIDYIVEGLGTSKVKNMSYSFYNCSRLRKANIDVDNVETANNVFNGCLNLEFAPMTWLKATNLAWGYNKTPFEEIKKFSAPNAEQLVGTFANMPNLISCEVENTHNVINAQQCFQDCPKLKSIKGFDFRSGSGGNFFNDSPYVEDLYIYNISQYIAIGDRSRWGTRLTDDSLFHTAKELWDMTGSTIKTLKVSTSSNARFDAIYVKLIDITDEMRAEDQYIDNKKPCEVCESIDEGAMTLREYVVSKNWALA